MKDPGFLAGLIGWAIGLAMSGILHQIEIVYCFRERLEHFQHVVKFSAWEKFLENLLEKRHFERASDIVNNGSKVPWFNVIKRYQMSKSIPELILNIQTAGGILRFQSMANMLSHEPTAISPPQPPPPPKCEPPPPPPPPKCEPPLPPLALASPPVCWPPSPPQPQPPPKCEPPPPPLALASPPAPPVFGALSQPPPAFSAPLPPPVFQPPSSPPAFLPLPPTEEETPSQALPAEEETTSQGLLAEEITTSQGLPEVDSTDHNDLDFSGMKNDKYLKHLTINHIMEIVAKIFRRRDDSAYLKHLLRTINPFMEMVKKISRRRDDSAYLKHLLRTINPTMEMVKKISRRRDDSALGWCELLQKLLEEATDLIHQIDRIRNFDIFRRYRIGKRIQRLTSRINEHLILFPFLEMMPASSNDPRESYFHEFSNNPSGS